ncbi:hypothetical protein BN14_06181 [Rhizoctonia solani AG-1 IB]|uniref:Uncharacterized protein n=1 Tax=Thanatephorus cucumeris (strain AG1-IB / isolate 7/3/14) TaxID=1108050 RepID=M5BWX2_THACB|nr:hypothetical protein BN14_06181 [Rhizoctonia solani AG-1 IB]
MMYQQTPSPPAADHDINTTSGGDDLVSPAIAKLLEGGFDLRLEEDVSESVISPAPDGRSTGRILSNGSKPKPTKQTGPDDIDGLRDNEEVQQELLMALVLDREVESNIFAFVMHGYISWMSQFIFEPARILPEVQARTQLWIKHEPSQALLMSNVGLAVSRATDYDLTDFRTWEKMVLDDILQARACNLKGPQAMRVMKHFHKVN